MSVRFEPGFSLAEALDILINEDIKGDIFMEPPDVSVEKDEDSADENEGRLVDNLSSQQLRANAGVRLLNNERMSIDYDTDTSLAGPSSLPNPASHPILPPTNDGAIPTPI